MPLVCPWRQGTADGDVTTRLKFSQPERIHIKLASVATDVMGVSGRAILRALRAGVVSPEALAELAKGRLRKKKHDLQAALLGRFRPHHTQLLTHILAHIEFLEE